MSCTCVKQESGIGTGKVKGYTVSTLCPECVAQQEADALESVERKKEEDANLMIAQRSYDDSKAKLISEGKIEIIDGKPKKK